MRRRSLRRLLPELAQPGLVVAALDAELKIRLEAELKRLVEEKAGREDRSANAIARRYIREGLIRDGLLAAEVQHG